MSETLVFEAIRYAALGALILTLLYVSSASWARAGLFLWGVALGAAWIMGMTLATLTRGLP